MLNEIGSILPFIVVLCAIAFLFYRIQKSGSKSDAVYTEIKKQTEIIQQQQEIAKENQDLMRRQVAALEEIAKKR